MPGLVPGIHVFLSCNKQDVDGRDKPGHDDAERRLRVLYPHPPAAGATVASGRLLRLSASATKPEAFISSMKAAM
jgi:hypothetical protein